MEVRKGITDAQFASLMGSSQAVAALRKELATHESYAQALQSVIFEVLGIPASAHIVLDDKTRELVYQDVKLADNAEEAPPKVDESALKLTT
jgi:hypothetical protein